MPSVRRVDRSGTKTDQSGTEQNGAEPSPVKTSRGRRALRACRLSCSPASRGGGAAVTGEDARARCRVPGQRQLPLAIHDYVPHVPGMTLPRTLRPEDAPYRARPVDPKKPHGGAFFGQVGRLSDTADTPGTILDITLLLRVDVVACTCGCTESSAARHGGLRCCSTERTGRKAECHERPAPAKSGRNQFINSCFNACSRASAGCSGPARHLPPGPAGRLGLRPDHPARTHRSAVRDQHPGQRPA